MKNVFSREKLSAFGDVENHWWDCIVLIPFVVDDTIFTSFVLPVHSFTECVSVIYLLSQNSKFISGKKWFPFKKNWTCSRIDKRKVPRYFHSTLYETGWWYTRSNGRLPNSNLYFHWNLATRFNVVQKINKNVEVKYERQNFWESRNSTMIEWSGTQNTCEMNNESFMSAKPKKNVKIFMDFPFHLVWHNTELNTSTNGI